jgi:hypothetical protein
LDADYPFYLVSFARCLTVEALQEVLINQIPGVCINIFKGNAQQWLSKVSLASLDCIVFAIGNPTEERYLAQLLRAQGLRVPAVITWLEALGLGGHAIGFIPNTKGCMDCLFRTPEGVLSLSPRVSFIAEGQVVSKNLTGCAGSFIPYSAIHSKKTALLASEITLQLMNDKLAPIYHYWQGNDTLALQEGIKTSEWYTRSMALNQKEVSNAIFRTTCDICGASA